TGSSRMTDLLRLDELLSTEEKAVRDRVRAFCDAEVVPDAAGRWERAEFPFELVPRLAGLGVCGGTLAGLSKVAAGLVALELGRADGSLATFFGVQSGLVMQSIAQLGSDAQREAWLPRLAAIEAVGAFALTEPEHGSDVAGGLETRARRLGDGIVLHGEKRWIGNASFADVIVVWARDDEGGVGGYLVERGATGLRTKVIQGKSSLRAVWQSDVSLDGVRVPLEARLPGCASFADLSRVLTVTRVSVAWRCAGSALACYEAALAYVGERRQFGAPLASFQLVQERLAGMAAETAAMLLLCHRLAQIEPTAAEAALAKMHNARAARRIAADARDLLGGNGILLDLHVTRHQADLEAVFTFEGTDWINALIVGRELTGIQAFTKGGR
ncbi:MAG: acyl-CoA dehydrogenase family protein, partial [Gaiellaceae bacterium]